MHLGFFWCFCNVSGVSNTLFLNGEIIWSRGHKNFMLNSAEHGIYHAHKMVKMFCILTSIILINTTSESLVLEMPLFFSILVIMSVVKTACSVGLGMNRFYNLGAW